MGDGNREQIEYWNGRQGERWVTHQESIDRVWQPIGEAAIGHAAVLAGEHVVDVGCGCGATSLALASRVGSSGSVLGVDISAPMLARARERAAALRLDHLKLVLADASSYPFATGADLVFSRMGVMFFADPVAAFTNLRRALRPGGRIVFACFRDRALNSWLTVPFDAAFAVIPPEPPPPADAPGPFSLAAETRLRAVLGGAGFADVACERVDHDLVVGEDVGSATDFSIQAGPVARVLADASEDVRARVRTAVEQSLARHVASSGVSLRAATWVVRATNDRS
jgi:SAM-dependent methyltransferase